MYGKVCGGVRISIPSCIQSKIREAFPEPDGNYVGFKAAQDKEDIEDIEDIEVESDDVEHAKSAEGSV